MSLRKLYSDSSAKLKAVDFQPIVHSQLLSCAHRKLHPQSFLTEVNPGLRSAGIFSKTYDFFCACFSHFVHTETEFYRRKHRFCHSWWHQRPVCCFVRSPTKATPLCLPPLKKKKNLRIFWLSKLVLWLLVHLYVLTKFLSLYVVVISTSLAIVLLSVCYL